MSNPRTGAPKRVAAGLLAGALSIAGIALAPTAGAAEDVTTERLAGATRYGTAAAVSADEAFAAPTRAIVASGENANLADALAASTLAGAYAPAPIILTASATYSPEAKAGLAALKGKGVSAVTIVGGTAAVSTAVEDAIKADGFTVTRVAGTDRFLTAAAIANAANAVDAADPVAGKDVALIASGASFADALAASPAAASLGLPLLLVNADSIPQATRDALDALDISQAVVLGGTVPVSDAVAAELGTLTGSPVQRLAGANRFSTAAAIGEYEIATLGFEATSAILANGITLVDALTAGPLGGLVEAPIVLTASLPAESQAFLDAHSNTITKLYVAGGTASVDDATVTAAETAAEATENDPATAGNSQTASLQGPELQDVAVSDIEIDDFGTAGDGLEVEYTFTFDTEIDEDDVDETAFKLYDENTNEFLEGADYDASGDSVAVWFKLAEGAGSSPLAAVATGAVVDEDGNENPAQSVEINPLSATPSHLTDIELTDEEDAIATFTFSGPVYPEALALGQYTFTLVQEDGTLYTVGSASADVVTAPEDDESSPTVEVTFDDLVEDEDPLTPDFDDIVRGYSTSFSLDNLPTGVINAVDIGGDTEGPDLEGIDLPGDNSELDDDEVLFSFDEEIDSANPTGFALYYGTEGSGVVRGVSLEIDGSDVTVTYDEEAVNDFVAGGFVLGDAAESDLDSTDAEGGAATAPTPNEADGEFFTYSVEPGDVAGPQLTGVDINSESDSFGEFEEFEIVFTFDQDLDETTGTSGFSVWFDEQDEVNQTDLDNCEVDDDNTVVCSDDDEDSDIALATVASVDAGSVLTADALNFGDGDEFFPNPEASFEVSAEEEPAA